ncbi:LysM peptidoglycan-binding domain-containing protein [Niallia endozanthoxylica]|uniref:LysM peptidoglycan-binding domain-containing protein n=1 Tax=Niallia endozanthoxylica TaxID=2036016 RepID=A0A5J5HQ22_9BACI|nr:LysM peptidoglycan-binding domain-containing protein [Niallia endozanthoxylica]KAA9023132.1 LysM peptidoglycan-binding domain-containing protein [Niallia endozanthoxylica]
MNLKLPKGKWAVIGTLLTIILLFTGIYFFVLYPKIGLIERKESELNTQQKILSALQSNMVSSNKNTFASTSSLQKLVPVKPLEQQFLLDIEKAEVVSGSFVSQMGFSEAELNLTEEIPQLEVDVEGEAEEEEKASAENETEEKPAAPALPAGVKKVTVTMTVESPSYFELETFLQTLENSQRITVIESIDFTANDEIIETEQIDKPLSYQVTVSAFYMPALTDLIDHLPKMESPEPANKKNPFSNFGQYDKGKVTAVYTPTNDPIVRNGEDVIYTVKPGDSLFSIAVQFYNSNEGLQKIRDTNGIIGNQIYAGQKLIIPAEKEKDAAEQNSPK